MSGVPESDRDLATRLVQRCLDFAGTGNDDAEAEMLDAEGAIIERLANPLHEDERDGFVCQTDDGLCWGVMTNYSVCAVPTTTNRRNGK